MAKSITVCAGIDTGKYKLDIALDGNKECLQVDNTPDGHARLVAWLRQHRVKRIGIEASGCYHQAVVDALRHTRFTVVVFEPARVRAYATFHALRAKNDRLDAALIALCTAAVQEVHDAPDPRIQPFASTLTTLDQLGLDIAKLKNRIETCRHPQHKAMWAEDIAMLRKRKAAMFKQLVTEIRQHPDLAERLTLINSVDGIGLPTAVAILVRMPEIGQVRRETAAALAGLAPFDDDSGERIGNRQIDGGRKRLRHALYTAALAAAFRWNAQLKALYGRLIAARKGHKRALVACARKMLIFANTVVARGTPWDRKPTTTTAIATAS